MAPTVGWQEPLETSYVSPLGQSFLLLADAGWLVSNTPNIENAATVKRTFEVYMMQFPILTNPDRPYQPQTMSNSNMWGLQRKTAGKNTAPYLIFPVCPSENFPGWGQTVSPGGSMPTLIFVTNHCRSTFKQR